MGFHAPHEAARILGPMNVGRAGDELAFTVRRAGGASGPEAARRLFGRLDDARIWCILEQEGVRVSETDPTAAVEQPRESVVASWDAALAQLPDDWSDLLCRLELGSSALLARAALLCAPLNPTLVLAHCPPLVRASAGMSAALEKSGQLPADLRDLVCLRVAQLIGCPF